MKSGIGAVVKVVNSHHSHGVKFLAKAAVFYSLLKQELISLCFMCSDQHVKYRMPRGFPLTSSLLLDYHVKQYIHTHVSTF